MADKVSIFGLRGSGKTCYIYAMSQVMKYGVSCKDTTISMIANDLQIQKNLNLGYEELANRQWPRGSSETSIYHFNTRILNSNIYKEIIPNLQVIDYKGGLLDGGTNDAEEFNKLMTAFTNSCALVFFIDGDTLLKAMNPQDQDPEHRLLIDAKSVSKARNRISWIENLLWEYKKKSPIPPILITITKSDLFLSKEEIERGKDLVKRFLPSIFGKGTKIDSAITNISLGHNLSHGENGQLCGNLVINSSTNIHIPIIYTLYAYIDSIYDTSDLKTQAYYDDILSILRTVLKGRIDMYCNGYPVFEV